MPDWAWLEDRIFERPVSTEEREALESVVSRVSFAPGERILVQNEPGDALYLLRSGRVAVELEFSGETVHLTELGEGAQVGDLSFLDDAAASASIVARTPCVAYRLTREALAQLFANRQSVARDLMVRTMRGMSRTIRDMNRTNAATLQYIRGRRT